MDSNLQRLHHIEYKNSSSFLINYYEKDGMILAGTFGIFYDSIANYFKSRGKKVTIDRNNPEKFKLDDKLKKCKVGIICYQLSNGGLHYIAAKWNKSGNCFEVYNYGYSDSSKVFISL